MCCLKGKNKKEFEIWREKEGRDILSNVFFTLKY